MVGALSFFELDVNEKMKSVIHYRSRRTPKNEMNKVSTERRERKIQILKRSEGSMQFEFGAQK